MIGWGHQANDLVQEKEDVVEVQAAKGVLVEQLVDAETQREIELIDKKLKALRNA